MSLLAEKPKLLKRIFITKELNPRGIYGLQLCANGSWLDIIIDDLLPCDADGKLLYAKVRVLLSKNKYLMHNSKSEVI